MQVNMPSQLKLFSIYNFSCREEEDVFFKKK